MEKNGKFYDGLSPISMDVSCIIQDDELFVFNSESRELIRCWKKSNLIQDEIYNATMVIGYKDDIEKLEILDDEFFKKLNVGPNKKIIFNYRILSFWLLGIGIGIVFFLFSSALITDHIAMQIPFEFERKVFDNSKIIGSSTQCELTSIQEAALANYLKLLYPLNEKETKNSIEILVVKNYVINAYAFPGGKILLTDALLQSLKNPEEFLGILSHEIAHITNRDSSKMFVRGALLTSVFGVLTGDYSGAFTLGPQVVLSSAALAYNREMELKADQMGILRLRNVGISNKGLYAFLERQAQIGEGKFLNVLMTHPQKKERLENINKEKDIESALTKSIQRNWKVIKSICQ